MSLIASASEAQSRLFVRTVLRIPSNFLAQSRRY
jgi:hypothetical protein